MTSLLNHHSATHNDGSIDTSSGHFDAIVVGAGAAGGLAAQLLCESGARVLVLDAGLPPSLIRAPVRTITHSVVRNWADVRLLRLLPPRIIGKGRRALKLIGRLRQPVQTNCYAWERLPEAFVDDIDCPYTTPKDKPFVWIRTWGPGGRMIVPGHGRQYYRMSREDLNPSDGLSPSWPIAPEELDIWYSAIESKLKLSGEKNGIRCLPDSEIATTLDRSPSERALTLAIKGRWPNANAVLGRHAPPLPSIASAASTGLLVSRSGAICREIEVDKTGHVTGVIWYDRTSRRVMRSQSNCVFLCASTLETTRILLMSSGAEGRKIGGSSGALGHYLMDHIMSKIEGIGPALADNLETLDDGRCVYLPRFDARDSDSADPARGFGVQIYEAPGLPGKCYYTIVAFSEMLPRTENKVSLDPVKKDAWGMPCLHIECAHGSQDKQQIEKQIQGLREVAAVMKIDPDDMRLILSPPGLAVHECGTARMGNDPRTSVLDQNNQCWDAKGLYVTDGASFPSQGSQNPTLTIMALTARACNHALRNVLANTSKALTMSDCL